MTSNFVHQGQDRAYEGHWSWRYFLKLMPASSSLIVSVLSTV